jgi:hypothetical protein
MSVSASMRNCGRLTHRDAVARREVGEGVVAIEFGFRELHRSFDSWMDLLLRVVL